MTKDLYIWLVIGHYTRSITGWRGEFYSTVMFNVSGKVWMPEMMNASHGIYIAGTEMVYTNALKCVFAWTERSLIVNLLFHIIKNRYICNMPSKSSVDFFVNEIWNLFENGVYSRAVTKDLTQARVTVYSDHPKNRIYRVRIGLRVKNRVKVQVVPLAVWARREGA